jgi:hypothetical protein
MDIEKYSYLWAKDSGWVLRTHGDSYRIFHYGEDGRMSTILIEDNELYEAIIKKMIKEGAKILTESEADELFKKMEDIWRKNAEKSRELIIQAEQALKNNQLIKNALRELLDNLDDVASRYPQIGDTMVRDILSDTILHHFVLPSSTDDIPSDNYYAMLSDEGDEAVHQTLVKFLTHPEVKAARQQLTIPEERLVVFQDSEVESANGNDYSLYFGWVVNL